MAKKRELTEDQERERINKFRTVIDKIFTDTEKDREDMSRYLRLYKGEWWDKEWLATHPQYSQIFVNFIFSNSMTIAPLLTDNRPVWAVRPRKPFLQKSFDLYSDCLEYGWDKFDMDMKMFKFVLDSLIMKMGVAKVTFDPKADFGGDLRIDIVDPRAYFCAPGYDDNWDAPFQGTRESKPLSWIRQYFPERGYDVKPDSQEEGSPMDSSFSEREDWELHNESATVYEIWMRDEEVEEYDVVEPGTEPEEKPEKGQRKKYPYGKIVTFTKDVFLEEKKYEYVHNRPPYVVLYDYIVPHQIMGMGEGDQIEELNRSYNKALQLIDKFTTQYADPNFLVDSSAGIDEETVREELPGGGNLWSYNGHVNQEPIKRVDVGNLPQDIYRFVQELPKLNQEQSGVTDVTKGMTAKAERQTAAEISTLLESSYTRTRQRVRNVEHFIKRLCYLFVGLMQQYYSNIREFTTEDKQTQEIGYHEISSKPDFMNDYMQKQTEGAVKQIQGSKAPRAEKKEAIAQEEEDYEKFQEFIKGLGDVDTVYADFDIVIDTNSTLPMDKQTLANLFLKLAQMKIVDPQAVLEQLKVPKAKEIVERMEARREQAIKAKTGGGQPSTPRIPSGPSNPQARDMSDMLKAPQGAAR